MSRTPSTDGGDFKRRKLSVPALAPPRLGRMKCSHFAQGPGGAPPAVPDGQTGRGMTEKQRIDYANSKTALPYVSSPLRCFVVTITDEHWNIRKQWNLGFWRCAYVVWRSTRTGHHAEWCDQIDGKIPHPKPWFRKKCPILDHFRAGRVDSCMCCRRHSEHRSIFPKIQVHYFFCTIAHDRYEDALSAVYISTALYTVPLWFSPLFLVMTSSTF